MDIFRAASAGLAIAKQQYVVNRNRAAFVHEQGTGLTQADYDSSLESDMIKVLVLSSLALLLFGSGVWATVSGGSLSQNKTAWVSHIGR